jgi:hypothetical protein
MNLFSHAFDLLWKQDIWRIFIHIYGYECMIKYFEYKRAKYFIARPLRPTLTKPYAYLREVFARLPRISGDEELQALLP